MNQGIFEHKAYYAACSKCGRPYKDKYGFTHAESMEAFIYRLTKNGWFADHVYALCPSCFGGSDDRTGM